MKEHLLMLKDVLELKGTKFVRVRLKYQKVFLLIN